MVFQIRANQLTSVQEDALKNFERTLRVLSGEEFLNKSYLPLCETFFDQNPGQLFYPMAGLRRAVDPEVVVEVIARLGISPVPMRVLEIGAGRTAPHTVDFGSPWLSRSLACAFPGSIQVTVSDQEETLLPQIETRLFGLSVRNIFTLDDLAYDTQQYDIIFARHIPSESYLVSEVQHPGALILDRLTSEGIALFGFDNGETVRVRRFQVAASKEFLSAEIRRIYEENL